MPNAPITKAELIAYSASGEKPRHEWRIGVEHEKFVFDASTHVPIAYTGERGILAILQAMKAATGWNEVVEAGYLIGLSDPKTGAGISLEPGGQFELSGAPLQNLHHNCVEVNTHLTQVKAIADAMNIRFLGLGFAPTWARDEIPVMPKGRYTIMRNYMPQVGSMGLDMMLRTCTVQVNLDYAIEADMVRKMRVSLALQPITTAMFANSPFEHGTPNGLLSKRSEIWRNTDPARTGMLPFAFEDGFGYEAYVDYVLDVPMYFIKRGDTYHDVSGLSFRDFMAGTLKGFEGQYPTIKDWVDHLSTTFPEVRLKKYLEMRGCDAGPWKTLCAMPALWVGLLYDETALNAAWDIAKGWTAAERQKLRDDVPQWGLKAKIAGHHVQELAQELLTISAAGLKARAQFNASGQDEQMFLAPVQEWVSKGRTPADMLLEAYHTRWGGDITPIFDEMAY